MKKYAIVLGLSLIVLPACRKKTWSWRSDNEPEIQEPSSQDGYKKGDKRSLFVDDVDAFVLEEDADPFAAPSPVTMRLTADDDQADAYNYASVSRDGFKTIYFDFDSSDVREDQQEALGFDARHIKSLANKGSTIMIEGHACDYAGSKQYNMQLSQKRAAQIKQMLMSRYDIDARTIKTVGRGCEMCIVPTGSKEQQAPNRRVEFYILK